MMAGNEQIAAEVAKNANGIGYVGLAYIHASGTKVVAVDDVSSSKETVINKKYAYARLTFYYTIGEPTGFKLVPRSVRGLRAEVRAAWLGMVQKLRRTQTGRPERMEAWWIWPLSENRDWISM